MKGVLPFVISAPLVLGTVGCKTIETPYDRMERASNTKGTIQDKHTAYYRSITPIPYAKPPRYFVTNMNAALQRISETEPATLHQKPRALSKK